MLKRILPMLAVLSVAAADPASAEIELRWWHAMTGGNNDMIVKIADDFNASQTTYKIVPTYKGSYADTMNSGLSAFRAGNAPHIIQIFEVGTASMMAARSAVKPVHELMREAGEAFDPKAYLPAIASYYSTSGGELLSFPFNSSSMVMWINRDAFRRAGLNPDQPPKTWPEVFKAANTLQAAGSVTCGFSTAWTTWANIQPLRQPAGKRQVRLGRRTDAVLPGRARGASEFNHWRRITLGDGGQESGGVPRGRKILRLPVRDGSASATASRIRVSADHARGLRRSAGIRTL
jgi:ABC-type glycerol-3-phosphate transport system substrate-binding protein